MLTIEMKRLFIILGFSPLGTNATYLWFDKEFHLCLLAPFHCISNKTWTEIEQCGAFEIFNPTMNLFAKISPPDLISLVCVALTRSRLLFALCRGCVKPTRSRDAFHGRPQLSTKSWLRRSSPLSPPHRLSLTSLFFNPNLCRLELPQSPLACPLTTSLTPFSLNNSCNIANPTRSKPATVAADSPGSEPVVCRRR